MNFNNLIRNKINNTNSKECISFTNVYILKTKEYTKNYRTTSNNLALLSKDINTLAIIHIKDKLFLNMYLDKLIFDYNYIEKSTIFDYKRIQEFKEDAFYQFSSEFACLFVNILTEEDIYTNKNNNKSNIFINDSTSRFNTKANFQSTNENESYIYSSLTSGINPDNSAFNTNYIFPSYQGKLVQLYYIKNLIIICFEDETNYIERIFIEKLNFNYLSTAINEAKYLNKEINKFNYKKKQCKSNINNNNNNDNDSYKNNFNIYNNLITHSDSSSDNINKYNKCKIINSFTLKNHKHNKNKLIKSIINLNNSTDFNLEIFYYHLFIKLISNIEKHIKEISKAISNLEKGVFHINNSTNNEDQYIFKRKKIFSEKLSQIEEQLLELKVYTSRKNKFLINNKLNYNILSLKNYVIDNDNYSIRFNSKMSIFISYLHAKTEEYKYNIYSLQEDISSLKSLYKTILVSTEFIDNRDYTKIMWKLTLAIGLNLLFNLLANFIGMNVRNPFSKSKSSPIVFYLILITGIILTILHFYCYVSSNLFKAAFKKDNKLKY